jgi:hypothetical protein
MAGLLSLQRTAGNRATVAMVARLADATRTARRPVQREDESPGREGGDREQPSDRRRETAGTRIERSTGRGPAPAAAPVGVSRLQRMFLESDDAEERFGAAFLEGKLDKQLPELNAQVAGLPDEPREWMEGLTLETKLSLLHQLGDRGDATIIVRICRGLVERPPGRYPDPNDDAACWRFLLEMAAANAVPKGLGTVPEWVAELKKIYNEADLRALEHDAEGFHLATEAGRRHLAGMRSEVRRVVRRPGDEPGDPRLVMAYLTSELTDWLRTLYQRAASSLGLTDYVLMAVGSAGREEMFPRSDVDYTVLVKALTKKVEAVDDVIALQLKLIGEPALDQFVKGTPEDVAAEHLVTKRDVLLDARVLHAEGPGGRELEKRYYESRHRLLGDEARRHRDATALIDTQSTNFAPPASDRKSKDRDVKKDLLRLPVFTTRNLCLYYGRETEQLNVWDRVADLVKHGIMSRKVADGIVRVVVFASELRLKLHDLYGSENETFRLEEGGSYRGYVLSESEKLEYLACVKINGDLHELAQAFSGARSMTLERLREGAKEKETTKTHETGVLRGSKVRTTEITRPDADVAILEEAFSEGDEVNFRRLTLGGEVFIVQPDGVLKTEKGDRKYIASEDNPFART